MGYEKRLLPCATVGRVGIDCELVETWRDILESHPEQIGSLFHQSEKAYCSNVGEPAEAYAGCWCAKEAVCKALGGFGALLPRDVLIDHANGGRPAAVVPSHISQEYRIDVSISHCGVFAMAVALLERRMLEEAEVQG